MIPKLQTSWDKHKILDYLLSIDEQLESAYRLKERYREFNMVSAYDNCDDEFEELIHLFSNHQLTSLISFSKILITWKNEIKNSFIRVDGRRLSNGPIEGINSQVKTIIKSSAGLEIFTD